MVGVPGAYWAPNETQAILNCLYATEYPACRAVPLPVMFGWLAAVWTLQPEMR